MAYSGWIDFPTAAAIVLGENIGTTITASIASLSANVTARRAARIHTVFNCLGILWMVFLFSPFIQLIDVMVPGAMNTRDGIPAHLAMFHTMFNITNTFIFIWFVPHLVALSKRLVTAKETFAEKYSLTYLASGLQHTPEIMVLKAKGEILKMADIVLRMFDSFAHVFLHPKKKLGKEVEELKEMEDYTDDMQEELSRFLVHCSADNVNDKTMQNINAMMRIVSELESIGDSCFNLILLAQRRYDKKIWFSDEAIQEIEPYINLVREFLSFNKERLNNPLSDEDLQLAVEIESRINNERDVYKKTSRKRLKSAGHIKRELLYIDFIKHLEHIGDHSLNISEALYNLK
jgi:phosphate:Na+ symporter